MGCNCGTSAARTQTNWQVISPTNEHLGSYRTEVEAAVAAARTPGSTYRPVPVG